MKRSDIAPGSWLGRPVGTRRAYHLSHVITPYVSALTTVEQRASLSYFERYNPHEPIVWRKSGRGLYWVTLKYASLEDELLRMARRRERGIRQSIATLARWTGSSEDLVSRVLKGLARRGIGTLTTERGRRARATFRLIGKSIPQPNRYKDAGLSRSKSVRYLTDPNEGPEIAYERTPEGLERERNRAYLEETPW